MTRKTMRLAAYFNPTGHHVASWRHPRAQADASTNIDHYVEIARTAERAKFDMIFLADSVATRSAHMDALSRSVQLIAHFEPFTLLSALAMATTRIGLVATASTTYNEPYHIARKFASLDHISRGRAGWNLVTSAVDVEVHNFGRAGVAPHAERYARATEFAEVVRGLWDSWDDDAFLRDAESGLFFDPSRMHVLHHKGERYSVRGPLNVPRTPQGHPVIVQAGASDYGRELAAWCAEAIFSPHLTIEESKSYYDDVKGRMAKYGRDPAHLKILPGLSVFVGRTDQEAKADYEYLQSLIHPMVGREILSAMLGGLDLAPYPVDGPLPDLPPSPETTKGHYESIYNLARRESLTILQLSERVAGARGKNTIHGSAVHVADYMQEWFDAGACDGFCIMPPYIPGCHDDFCNMVIPELQNRGLFRTDYEGTTLRDHLGLPKPVSRYARPQSVDA